jgi:hypothetical protein
MEANAPKLNLTVHLGEDKGQALLGKVDFTNHVGEQEVSVLRHRSNKQKSKLR